MVELNSKKNLLFKNKYEYGAVYIWMLLLLIFISLGIGRWSVNYATLKQREKEQDLLRVGLIYQNAIFQYYNNSPGGVKDLPEKLEDLLKDPRSLEVRRYMRKLEKDPISQHSFEVVRNSSGKIIGVHSPSDQTTIKKSKFPEKIKYFEGSRTYRDWIFKI
ncbi:type II secretion system protein [Acinetobacter seifertii]|jgi:hypothetical protein|nr:type II secretion system protein [Acinetobacter seifertii]